MTNAATPPTQDHKETGPDLTQAKAALAKLPMLGPVMWLYARDTQKRWTFIAEQDWLLMPPLVLDQCKLYTRQEIPWAYCSWAKVDDLTHERLKSGVAKIAPNEWNAGSYFWLIDLITPFGDADKILMDLRTTVLTGQTLHRQRVPKPGEPLVGVYEMLEAI